MMLNRIRNTFAQVDTTFFEDVLGALSLIVILVAALHLPVLV